MNGPFIQQDWRAEFHVGYPENTGRFCVMWKTLPAFFGTRAGLAACFEADLIVANVINLRDVAQVTAIEDRGYDLHPEEMIRGLKEDRRELPGRHEAGGRIPQGNG